MKRCPRCLKSLPSAKFNWKIKNVRLAAYCKKCSRLYIKEHYDKNRKYYLDKAHRRNFETRQKAFGYIGSYLKTHPCVDCGESDILVLEFDHIDRKNKEHEMSRFIRSGVSLPRIISEVSKCEVRCANCHRRKTARESNSWKLIYAPVA